MRWRKLRKWAKWTCTALAVLTIGLAVFGRFFAINSFTRVGNDLRLVRVGEGLLWEMTAYGYFRQYPSSPLPRWQVVHAKDWYWGRAIDVEHWDSGLLFVKNNACRKLGTTLVYPIILVSCAAGVLWFADRHRFGPGLCTRCGYDRRGLAADAKCPECGTVPAPAAK